MSDSNNEDVAELSRYLQEASKKQPRLYGAYLVFSNSIKVLDDPKQQKAQSCSF